MRLSKQQTHLTRAEEDNLTAASLSLTSQLRLSQTGHLNCDGGVGVCLLCVAVFRCAKLKQKRFVCLWTAVVDGSGGGGHLCFDSRL